MGMGVLIERGKGKLEKDYTLEKEEPYYYG